MSFIIFILLTTFFIKNPAYLGFILVLFFIGVSLFTPFWPIVFVGFFINHQFSKAKTSSFSNRKKQFDEWQ